MTNIQLYHGDCLDVLKTIPDVSVDCVITDPPYPEIKREYGRMTESEWWDMMMGVCAEVRRVLKPTGSAVFVLQPNSRKIGSMRGWLFEFQAWICREWNMVQDAYWWNIAPMPEAHAIQGKLMRPSLKACVWAGPDDCYRNQEVVLWDEADSSKARVLQARANNETSRRTHPSGHGNTLSQMSDSANRRGGVTPMNVFPCGNSAASNSAGAYGHGAGTPLELTKWWTRYICPPGGTVLDPFVGSGTMMLAAMHYGCNGIGIERMEKYVDIAQRRIEEARAKLELETA